jgi:hypothetical protein
MLTLVVARIGAQQSYLTAWFNPLAAGVLELAIREF